MHFFPPHESPSPHPQMLPCLSQKPSTFYEVVFHLYNQFSIICPIFLVLPLRPLRPLSQMQVNPRRLSPPWYFPALIERPLKPFEWNPERHVQLLLLFHAYVSPLPLE